MRGVRREEVHARPLSTSATAAPRPQLIAAGFGGLHRQILSPPAALRRPPYRHAHFITAGLTNTNALRCRLEGHAPRAGERSPVATILAGPLGCTKGLAPTAVRWRERGGGAAKRGGSITTCSRATPITSLQNLLTFM
jgi:hypothetical protein